MTSYGREKFVMSPHSSQGEAESIRDTPDTTLTAFSPEDIRRGPIVSSRGTIIASAGNRDDPFVTSSITGPKTTLSAQASAFTPGFTATVNSSQSNADNVESSRQSTPNNVQHGTFTTDTSASRCLKANSIYGDVDVPALVHKTALALDKEQVVTLDRMRIDILGNGCLLRCSDIKDAAIVYNTLRGTHQTLAIDYMKPSEWGLLASPGRHYSDHEGQVMLSAEYPATVSYDKKGFEQNLRQLLGVSGELVAWQKFAATEAGVFRLVAEFYDADHATAAVERVHGRVLKVGKHFITLPHGSVKVEVDVTVKISVEFHQPDHSAYVTQRSSGHGTPTRGVNPSSDLNEAFGSMGLSNPPPLMGPILSQPPIFAAGPAFAGIPYAHYGMGGQVFGRDCGLYQGPGGNFAFVQGPIRDYSQYQGPNRDAEPYQSRGYAPYHGSEFSMSPSGQDQFDRPFNRRQNAVKVPGRPRNNNTAASNHNYVDVDKILDGMDVRTTVMLRNIPNKLSQAQLKEIVDDSSACKYDFMYLRIDFSNDCNVGYAFINFTDPLDIIDFVRTRSGQKWYKSDKVAEVSYATIQGKDCLVQKFRNSSVMLEPPHYRPKLYFTYHDGEFAGQEERFPESDNASKLKRSCENAEHVGLFAPNPGNSIRDEQRRRGNFDRGTTLAQREEFNFGARPPHGRSYGGMQHGGMQHDGQFGFDEYVSIGSGDGFSGGGQYCPGQLGGSQYGGQHASGQYDNGNGNINGNGHSFGGSQHRGGHSYGGSSYGGARLCW
ncbi:RNA recognition motif 2-domain-containing protein [Calycina marina]|uniref:RNA recognition motif 2-domain-containing protein n=1 Tax=Calycina marina TaxID=1763456 RepID=A0A9P7Z6Q1_9HELO|nr:RNA recognition motif 2-domain-containing protein [Calycina marina]